MSTLHLPPANLSICEKVKSLWQPVLKTSRSGADVNFEINQIKLAIEKFETELHANRLPTHFDWTEDLRKARRLHDFYVFATNSAQEDLTRWYSFWQQQSEKRQAFTFGLAQEGIKYTLLLHGATAIACFNALANSQTSPYRASLLLGMLGAFVGIVLLTSGTALLINVVSHQNERIGSKLQLRKKWRTLHAIYRWMARFHTARLKLADFLIYGSIFWFAAYVFVCLLLILYA